MKNNIVFYGMKYFWSLFLLNTCFILGNAVLVFSLIFVKPASLGLLFYLSGVVLVFPNLLALFNMVREVVVKKRDTKLIRRYFEMLKTNAKIGVLMAVPYCTLVGVCLVNLLFLGQNQLNGFSPFFIVVMIIACLHILITLCVQTEMYISLKDSMKMALFILTKNAVRGVLGVMIIFGGTMIAWALPQYFVLFGFSSVSALAIFLLKKAVLEAMKRAQGEDIVRQRALMRQLL